MGKIISIKGNYIIYNADTDYGSSGSPIIRVNNNNVIGLHFGRNKKSSYNIGTSIDSILQDIKIQLKEKYSQIKCIYLGKEISLLHDYNYDFYFKNNKSYLEAKKLNKSIFEESIELFINDKKSNFTYIINNEFSDNEIKVKFILRKKITNMS